jgi:hypothetical protein
MRVKSLKNIILFSDHMAAGGQQNNFLQRLEFVHHKFHINNCLHSFKDESRFWFINARINAPLVYLMS